MSYAVERWGWRGSSGLHSVIGLGHEVQLHACNATVPESLATGSRARRAESSFRYRGGDSSIEQLDVLHYSRSDIWLPKCSAEFVRRALGVVNT